jgi:hypothetical protein
VNKNRDLIYYTSITLLHFISLDNTRATPLFLTFVNLILVEKQLYREMKRRLSVLLGVKSLGSRSLFLFRGSEALPLARGGLSEAQGSRFEGLAPCISALRLASLEHYSEVLRLAPCLAPCASMEEGGE